MRDKIKQSVNQKDLYIAMYRERIRHIIKKIYRLIVLFSMTAVSVELGCMRDMASNAQMCQSHHVGGCAYALITVYMYMLISSQRRAVREVCGLLCPPTTNVLRNHKQA